MRAPQLSHFTELFQNLGTIKSVVMVDFARHVLPLDYEIRIVLQAAVGGPKRARELLASISPDRQAYVFRVLGWKVKVGALRMDPV